MLIENNEVLGISPKYLRTIEFAKNVAVTKNPVLLVGEEGTGKRQLCNYIHQSSARREQLCLIVDCSDTKENIEKNILGYRDEAGKFHKGVLERANNGMVVLANIEGLDLEFQKKLNVILNELPDYDLDIRLIATTTKNLSKYVSSSRFCRPLFSIFSGTQITVPSLRDRKEDLKAIVSYFVAKYSFKYQRPALPIADVALEVIGSSYWSQNYLELSGVIESIVKNPAINIIDRHAIEESERSSVSSKTGRIEEDSLKLMSLKEAEKLLIKKALIHTSENRTQAAKILGVSIRTLRNKINEYRGEGSQFFLNLR